MIDGALAGRGSTAVGGRRFLLTGVISRYPLEPLWNREELAEDLQRMIGLFTGALGYQHVQAMGLDPTWLQIRDALRDFSTSADRQADDYVTVYLAGHGEILPVGDAGFEHVLLPADASRPDLRRRAVKSSDLAEWMLADTSVQRLLLIVDASYAGTGGLDFARNTLAHVEARSKLNKPGSGVVVVTATQPTQEAIAGAFTGAFARAVRSLATARHAPGILSIDAVLNVMRNDPELPASQQAQWSLVAAGGTIPNFLPNPYRTAALTDLNLATQEPKGRVHKTRDLPRLRAFVSYSQRDERYRQKLDTALAQLRRNRLISVWHDREILPGQEWDREIDKNLESADIILVLVSADFLASDYAYSSEMLRAMERHQTGSAIVIPIILRPSDWQHSPLASLQVLPSKGRPVSSWPNRDQAWLDIAQGLRRIILGQEDDQP